MIFAGGRTLFDNTVDLLKKSGINDVFVVVCHQKERLIEHIQNQVNNGINLHYLEQRQEGGIGQAVMQFKDKISPGEYFLLIYGDTITRKIFSARPSNLFTLLNVPSLPFACPHPMKCSGMYS